MKKSILLIISLIILVFLISVLFKSQFYHFLPDKEIDEKINYDLFSLGKQSLKSLDVPVASIILYNNKIIGKGYNTVIRDSSAGEHAEINAISDAIKHVGFKKFNELNRDSLVLISSFEPCEMCKGAIQLYNIKYVYFLKGKPLTSWMKNLYRDFLYETNKYKAGSDFIQDSLFSLHPYFGTPEEKLIP